jgi:pimeloyl-ACP methyl ester carboxylesterase
MAKPSIVFAHGLCADGSCFSKLIPTLQAEGHEVMASQHGLDSLATDVAAVKACFARVSSPIVLVGHSYGGTLITHAGADPGVAALVYIAALAPDADETSQGQIDKFPSTPVFKHLDVSDGRIWLKPSGVTHFCGDLSEADQRLVYATQGVPVADLQSKGRRHGVEVETELVCPSHPRPDGSSRSATLRFATHESRYDRGHVEPCAHAVEA